MGEERRRLTQSTVHSYSKHRRRKLFPSILLLLQIWWVSRWHCARALQTYPLTYHIGIFGARRASLPL